jgi:hypothetical protein
LIAGADLRLLMLLLIAAITKHCRVTAKRRTVQVGVFKVMREN